MAHYIPKPEDSSPEARLEPALQHWWQARKADMLTVTPRVALNISVLGYKSRDRGSAITITH